MMIRELGKGGKRLTETESSSPQRRKVSGAASFGRGFVQGVGSVGYVFRNAQPASRKKSLAVKLAQASGTERKAVATMAKRQIVAKYVGNAMAKKLCSVSSGTREGRARRVDVLMMNRDFAVAVSKVHG